MKGKVKMFNQEKGYGFITKEDGKDVFFHYSQLMMEGFKTIDNDVEVEFEEVDGVRGTLSFLSASISYLVCIYAECIRS